MSRDELSPPLPHPAQPPSGTGGRRRSRRLIVVLLLIAALLATGFGAREFLLSGEPPPKVPEHPDDHSALVSTDAFENLARENPIALLDQCLLKYTREVKGGIHCTLEMQERVGGAPQPPAMPGVEVIDLFVRGDVPDSAAKTAIEVMMKWKSGAKKAQFPRPFGAEICATLFSDKPKAAGGLDGRVVTWRPEATFSRLGSPLEPTSEPAKKQARYCIRDAGLYRSMLRTYDAWKGCQNAGELKVEYLGKKTIPQIGCECYVIKRICPRTEIDSFQIGGVANNDPQVIAVDGFTEVTIYIDTKRWLQVGTELFRTEPDGTRVLVGTYYFRNVQLNPTFAPDTFTVEGLKK